jgi:radical SAM-linked protein
MRFAKGPEIRFISHLDLLRVVELTLRRSGLPLVFSEGFSPHPRLHAGPPLPVGIVGAAEWIDIELAVDLDPEEIARRLNAVAQPGLTFLGGRVVTRGVPALTAALALASYTLAFPAEWRGRFAEIRARAEAFGRAASFPIVEMRKEKERTIDFRRAVRRLELHEAGESLVMRVVMQIADPQGHNTNPVGLLKHVFGIAIDEMGAVQMTRDGLLPDVARDGARDAGADAESDAITAGPAALADDDLADALADAR